MNQRPSTKRPPVLPFRLVTFTGEGDRIKIDRFETQGQLESAASRCQGRALAMEVIAVVNGGDEGGLTADDVRRGPPVARPKRR